MDIQEGNVVIFPNKFKEQNSKAPTLKGEACIKCPHCGELLQPQVALWERDKGNGTFLTGKISMPPDNEYTRKKMADDAEKKVANTKTPKEKDIPF